MPRPSRFRLDRITPLQAALILGLPLLLATGLIRFAGADGTRRLLDGVREIDGGTFEASGVVHVPRTSGVLFVSDHESGAVFWMELNPDGTQQAPAVRVPLGANVSDPEGITTDGSRFYVVGSQSKGGEQGADLVRFAFDPGTHRVAEVEQASGLRELLLAGAPQLRQLVSAGDEGELNVEGLAWDPDRRRLLLGLRTPIADGAALVVPVALGRDGSFSREALSVDGGRALALPTDGEGIRSLEYDTGAGRFQVLTARESDGGASRLLEWDGADGGALREVAAFPGALKPEGLSRLPLGGRAATIVVFDTSRYLLMPR